jgi:hypothetical protein
MNSTTSSDAGGAGDLSGWTRMTTTDEPRLSELVELYRELGFEVLLRPVSREELGGPCSECMLATPERYRTIYTRPMRPRQG